MKIYTKSGDSGTSSLFSGTRVPKHHIRLHSYGTIDELNSWLGLLCDHDLKGSEKEVLKEIQSKLFTVGAILATEPAENSAKTRKTSSRIPKLSPADTELLEKEMDRMNENLPEMTNFILPGGHILVSYCHIARTVCRRAERFISLLHDTEPVPRDVLTYVNRLSDYLFVLARKLSSDWGGIEIKWVPDQKT